MNFTALKAELAARGFDYLSDTRQGQYINDARAELDDTELWPYRATSSTVAAGLSQKTIADLGPIMAVQVTLGPNAAHTLRYETLGTYFGEEGTAGSAMSYYVLNGAVYTNPNETAHAWAVYYYKVPADLSSGSDTPLAPARFHMLIVDMAVQRAYRDADNHDAAAALQGEIERRLGDMRNALLLENVDGPQDFISQRAGWEF